MRVSALDTRTECRAFNIECTTTTTSAYQMFNATHNDHNKNGFEKICVSFCLLSKALHGIHNSSIGNVFVADNTQKGMTPVHNCTFLHSVFEQKLPDL